MKELKEEYKNCKVTINLAIIGLFTIDTSKILKDEYETLSNLGFSFIFKEEVKVINEPIEPKKKRTYNKKKNATE